MGSALWGTTVGLVAVAAMAIGIAASQSSAPGGAHQAEPPAYRPVTSDLMNDVIQPRHVKLWLAGKSQNWAFAEYERHNIGGALARMTRAIPTYKDLSTASLVGSFATLELADLETAIKARNEMAFVQAYNALTTGCNSCHQAIGHGMVVIKVPDSDPFPDQDFRPPAP